MNVADFEAAQDLCSLAHIGTGGTGDDNFAHDEVFGAKLLLERLKARTPATFAPTAPDCELLATLARKADRLIAAGVFASGGRDVERITGRLREVGVELMGDAATWRDEVVGA